MSPPPEIEALLAEDAWLRRLARGLVADPHRADDLVQEAWLTALRRPGGARGGRAWLGGVLRNLRKAGARGAARRERHERSAAREAAAPETAALVAELELRRELADRLLALEEPLRTAVVLRFFRDLPLKEVAARTGVPTSTAHARVERGLARLRAALDRSHGGERGAWALALAPLARSAGGAAAGGLATTTIGAFAMTTAAKIGATLAVGACALGLYLASDRAEPAPPEEELAAAPAEAEEADESLALPAPEEPPRAAVAAATPADAEAPEAAPAPDDLPGRVIDTAKRPLAGVRIDVVDDGEVRASARTGADGRLRLPRDEHADAPDWIVPSLARLVGGELRLRDAALALLATGLDAERELLVVAEPRADFAGVVVDADGAPLAGASVAVRVRQALYRELGLVGFESPEHDAWSATSGADGRFRIDGACGGERVFLDVELAGYEGREVPLPRFGSTDLVVTLERLDDAIDVVGRVVDAAGAPVEDARVSMGAAIERTDAGGRFRIRWSEREAREDAPYVQREDGVWAPREEALRIAAAKPGLLPAWRELEEADLAEPLLLRLGPAPLAITGRVVDAEGEPVAGAAVWAIDPHELGREVQRQGEFSSSVATTVEEVLRGGGYGRRGAATDGEGRFALEGLMEGEYTLRALDPARLLGAEDRTVAAGAEDVEIALAAPAGLARVAGRVVSPSGAPIAGVEVTPRRDYPGGGSYGGLPMRLARTATTDAEGRFDLGELAVEGARLELFSDRIFFRSVELDGVDDTAALEIVEPLLCELQVELVDPASGIVGLRFLDADGEPLEIVESYGVYVTMGREARLREGRSGVLLVPEDARTLVLLTEEGEELGRRALRLDPDARTELSL